MGSLHAYIGQVMRKYTITCHLLTCFHIGLFESVRTLKTLSVLNIHKQIMTYTGYIYNNGSSALNVDNLNNIFFSFNLLILARL